MKCNRFFDVDAARKIRGIFIPPSPFLRGFLLLYFFLYMGYRVSQYATGCSEGDISYTRRIFSDFVENASFYSNACRFFSTQIIEFQFLNFFVSLGFNRFAHFCTIWTIP